MVKSAGDLVPLEPLNRAFLADGWGRGWPGTSNTGYANAPDYPGSLTAHDDSVILSDTEYRFVDFVGAGIGSVSVPVHGTSFYGCRFKNIAVAAALTRLYGDGPVSFDYCSFEPGMDFADLGPGEQPPYEISYQYGLAFGGSYGTFAAALTVENCDFWGFGNAIDGAGSTIEEPSIFRHNWIHDAAYDGGVGAEFGQYHTDGIGNTGGIPGLFEYGIVIEHNTIEAIGNTNGIALQGPTNFGNITVRQNLLGGFGFCVMIWAPAPDTVFTDNVFSTRLRPLYGPLYNQPFWNTDGNVWRRNRLRVPEGAAWGNPAHDGRYWVPNSVDLNDVAFSSSTISSVTDYAG